MEARKNYKEKFIIYAIVFVLSGIFLIKNYYNFITPRVIFCDVGQGDSALIILPNGEDVLIDAGPDKSVLFCLGKYMPYFDRVIEHIIISHPDKDHFAGMLYILDRYKVGQVYLNGDDSDIPEHSEMLRKISKDFQVLKKGDVLRLDSAEIKIFYPAIPETTDDNNLNSLVFKFLYGNTSILFTGDAPEDIEKILLTEQADILSKILKVSHHGSKTATSAEFLRAINPKFAVISVGVNNKYGHPTYKIINRLERMGIVYFRTDEVGDVVFKLDQ